MATASFSLVTPQHVTGVLKATGSRDSDVLFAAKEAMLEPIKPLKFIGLWAYVTGGLLTITILGAFLGIPLLGFGWWTRRRGRTNIETVESTFASYVASLGLKPRAVA